MEPTWGEKSEFDYSGDFPNDTTIRFGTDLARSYTVTADQWDALLKAFQGRGYVALGTSRDSPPPGSIGEWWKSNYNTPALMSYIGRILLLEGYAQKRDDRERGILEDRGRECGRVRATGRQSRSSMLLGTGRSSGR